MARQSVGFIDLHIEKIVLGLCGVVLLGTILYAFGGFRFSVDGCSPGDLSVAAKEQADRLADAVRNAKPRPTPPPSAGKSSPEPDQDIKHLIGWFEPSTDGGPITKVAQSPHTVRFPPPRMANVQVAEEDRHNLARIVAPSNLIMTTGRTVFELPPRLGFDEFPPASPSKDVVASQRDWVSVAAQVDLVVQEENFLVEKYPHESYLTIVKVHLQRLDTTKPGSDWETVDTYLPFSQMKRPPIGEEIDDFRRRLDLASNYIARPRFPERKSGDSAQLPAVPYLDEQPKVDAAGKLEKGEAARFARKWYDLAKKAIDGKAPFKAVDPDAALMLARAVKAKATEAGGDLPAKADALLKDLAKKAPKDRPPVDDPPPPERLMPVVAHDFDVEPGSTYIYRLRLEVLNRLAGIGGELKDPIDAERLTMFSDWSKESKEVTPESDIYFFFDKVDRKTEELTATVYRKSPTGFKSKEFGKIVVGSEIGGKDPLVKRADFTTNAVVVDIDFDRDVGGKKDVAIVWLDLNTQQLRERILSEDKNSKKHKELAGKSKAP